MKLHGVGRDPEARGDRPVAEAPGHHLEDLALACRQGAIIRDADRARRRPDAQGVGMQRDQSGRRGRDRRRDLLRPRVLTENRAHAGPTRRGGPRRGRVVHHEQDRWHPEQAAEALKRGGGTRGRRASTTMVGSCSSISRRNPWGRPNTTWTSGRSRSAASTVAAATSSSATISARTGAFLTAPAHRRPARSAAPRSREWRGRGRRQSARSAQRGVRTHRRAGHLNFREPASDRPGSTIGRPA